MLNPLPFRLEQYLNRRATGLCGKLGEGKDGAVWRSTRLSAIKLHQVGASYRAERNAYIRLRDVGITNIEVFSVPKLLEYDDDFQVIEMSIVSPPFIVDFASAYLDDPPDFIEDEGNSLFDMIRERFDSQAEQVIAIYHELILQAGIYLSDFHRHNIKFA